VENDSHRGSLPGLPLLYLCRFRKDNQSHLKKLFLKILRLCVEADIVKLGNVSLDGTKIKANASLSANRILKHLEQEIDKMLSEAEAKDAEEDKVYGTKAADRARSRII